MPENIKRDLPFTIRDLLDINEWQKIQDNFSVITNVGLRLLDTQYNMVTEPSGETRLCKELLKNNPLKESICGQPCIPTLLNAEAEGKEDPVTVCKADLHSFISPLKVGFETLGYIILGPVILVMRKSKEEYLKNAQELNIDLDEFWSALSEIKIISFNTAKSFMALVKDVAEYLLKLSAEKAAHAKQMFQFDSPKLTKFLQELLDVAFQVTGATIGSVMFVTKDSQELSIRAAKGLSEEIVANTRVKIGIGISGKVAQEGTPYLLDETLNDNRIKPYLTRPSINSSMVLPIKVNNRVMGVLNLGTLRPSPVRFNLGNIKLISRLIDLSTLALQA